MNTTGGSPYPIRTMTGDDFEQYDIAVNRGFGEEPVEADREFQELIFNSSVAFASLDGDEIVGTTAHFCEDLTLPGGSGPNRFLPCAAVTAVSTSGTHRRRGVLTSLMRHQLHGLHDAGQVPLAVLWASEGAIYGRFGYGLAAMSTRLTVQHRYGDFIRPVTYRGRIRWGSAEKDRAALEAVKAAFVRSRPGSLGRTELGWEAMLRDGEHRRHGASSLRILLAESAAGQPEGYALLRTKPDWDGVNNASGEVRLRELHALTPPAYAALWRQLLDLDLMTKTEVHNEPIDSPLLHLMAHPRRAGMQVYDGLWVRLVDLPAALTGRGYAREIDVTLRVHDGFCGWNDGTWRLQSGPEPTVTPAADSVADLELDARDLGAIYLGGTTLETLAAAGRAIEHAPGTLRAASLAFGGSIEPWCSQEF